MEKGKRDLIREVYTAEANLEEAISLTLDACEKQVMEIIQMGASVYLLTDDVDTCTDMVTASKYVAHHKVLPSGHTLEKEDTHLLKLPKGLRFVREYRNGPIFLVRYNNGIVLDMCGLDQSLAVLKEILEMN